MSRGARVEAAVWALAALPLLALGIEIALRGLGANPIEQWTHVTGEWALRGLLASLAVTPLRRWTRWSWLAPTRRALGLVAVAYAGLHFLIYAVLDLGLDWSAVAEDVLERPYVTAGATALLLLLPLAATSTRAAQRRLGRRWVSLHRLVYVSEVAVEVHHLWLVKADLRPPLVHAAILALLLGARALPVLGRRLRPGRAPASSGRSPEAPASR